MSSEHGPSAAGLLGTIFLVIGALWMALSGVCTAIFTWLSFDMGRGDWKNFLSAMPVVLGVGGVSILIGFAIWFVGKALRQRGRG